MKVFLSREETFPISNTMYGLCLDDVNYAVDGGIYAQMLENRNFEAKNVSGDHNEISVKDDGVYAWEVYPQSAPVALKMKTDRPLYAENPHYMRLTAQKGGVGVKNKAYDGIYLQKGMKYALSFWLRSYEYKGKAKVGVRQNGAFVLGKEIKIKPDGKWRQYSFKLKSKANVHAADFVFLLGSSGTVHLDWFSLIPENALKGVFRRDILELTKALKPSFLRFPGGRVVEGNALANRYIWKNSVGERERRKQNWNAWAAYSCSTREKTQFPFAHYGQTLGIGYYEYFLLCEYLATKPIPSVSIGISNQDATGEYVSVKDSEMEGYVQDVLDLIEFVIGNADTEWGRVREEMGHSAPFTLEYLQLGAEPWERIEKDGEYYERILLFERRIHEKYPNIKLLAYFGTTANSPSQSNALKWLQTQMLRGENFEFIASENYCKTPQWLFEHTKIYAEYPQTIQVSAEINAQNGGADCLSPQANTWESALSEAAFYTGLECCAQVVRMSSNQTLCSRIGYAQKNGALIWFDGKQTLPTASYFVQKLFSEYLGTQTLQTNTFEENNVYASATERDGMVYLKLVNIGAEKQTIEIDGDFDFGAITYIIGMEGEFTLANTLAQPRAIVPHEVAPTAARTVEIPAQSLYVLIFHK